MRPIVHKYMQICKSTLHGYFYYLLICHTLDGICFFYVCVFILTPIFKVPGTYNMTKFILLFCCVCGIFMIGIILNLYQVQNLER